MTVRGQTHKAVNLDRDEPSARVGEVQVMPEPLHAFTMAICRADGSSAEEGPAGGRSPSAGQPLRP